MNKKYYSASTGGFYASEIHGDNIPADAKEITDEQHAILLEGQSSGSVITAGKDGYPTLTEPVPHVPTKEEEFAALEQTRKNFIAEVDSISPAQWFGISDDLKIELSSYRKNLEKLDLSVKPLVWPVKPRGL